MLHAIFYRLYSCLHVRSCIAVALDLLYLIEAQITYRYSDYTLYSYVAVHLATGLLNHCAV